MIGNAVVGLVTVIVFCTIGLATHKEPIKFDESSRIESVVVENVVEVPPVETAPVVAPVEQPKPAGDCSLAYNYDWPQNIAYSVCMIESSGNPMAANWSDNHTSWAGCMGSFGLMQINCSHGQLYDGVANMDVAYSMYKGWGNSFAAWTSCKKVPNCR